MLLLFSLFCLFSELATLLVPLCQGVTLLPCLLMGLPDLQTLWACENIHEPQTVKFEVQKCENYGTLYYLHTRLSPRWKRTLAKYSMTDILLTLVSNIYKAALISLFMAPQRLNKLWEVGFQFPFILTGKSQWLFQQANHGAYPNPGIQVGPRSRILELLRRRLKQSLACLWCRLARLK